MMINVQYVSIGLAMTLLIFTTYLTWKQKLENKTSFLWLLISIIGVIISFLLPTFDRWTAAVGVAHFPTFLFSMLFIFIIMLLIYKSVLLHQVQRKLTELTQNSAIQFYQVNEEMDQLKKREDER